MPRQVLYQQLQRYSQSFFPQPGYSHGHQRTGCAISGTCRKNSGDLCLHGIEERFCVSKLFLGLFHLRRRDQIHGICYLSRFFDAGHSFLNLFAFAIATPAYLLSLNSFAAARICSFSSSSRTFFSSIVLPISLCSLSKMQSISIWNSLIFFVFNIKHHFILLATQSDNHLLMKT